jgi:hypothetical protein
MLSFINYQVGGSRERRAGATPDAHPSWVRFDDSPRGYHAIVDDAASILTACNGRGSATDVVARHDNPPEEERCLACSRRLTDTRRITAGLTELRRQVEWLEAEGMA